MPRVKAITLAPTALDRNGISVSQTPGAGGVQNLTITGTLSVDGSVTFTQAQHGTIYSAASEVARVFTFTGTDRYGNAMTEDVTGGGVGATVVTVKNFKTITQISVDADTAGAVEAGVDGTCESQWFLLNYRGNDFNVGLGGELTGAATWAVQHTFNDILADGFLENDAEVFTHTTLTGKTAAADSNYTNPPVATRLAITAFTSGEVTLRVNQAGW